jgi:hypothetical protein
MLDFDTIYKKTDAGLAEVEARTPGLRSELRRLLTLVDGSASVSRLARFVRGSEIAPLIFELEAQGLIASPTSSVYRKSDAGVAEVQNRALGLRSDLRLLLILADGQTDLSRLASFVPNRPILELIAELESAGLIAPHRAIGGSSKEGVAAITAQNEATLPETTDAPEKPRAAAAKSSVADERWQIVRGGAERGLRRVLGVEKHELLDRLRQPQDSLALRIVITGIQQTLEEQFGVETGQLFLDSVRSAANNSRDLAN